MSFGDAATPAGENTIQKAVRIMNDLFSTQKKVDAALEKMPPGPDKDRLLKARADNRGFFSKYVLPAWEKVKSYVSGSNPTTPVAGEMDFGELYDGAADETMGILPLIGYAAAIAAAGAIGTYATTSYLAERKILDDPSLSAAQKTELLQSRGVTSALSGVASNMNRVILLAGLGVGLYVFLQMKGMKRANPCRTRKRRRRR